MGGRYRVVRGGSWACNFRRVSGFGEVPGVRAPSGCNIARVVQFLLNACDLKDLTIVSIFI